MASGKRLWAPGRGKGTAPHRPTLTSSIVAALLAVGVVTGFVVLRTGSTSSSSSQTPRTGTSLPPPSTSVPLVTAPLATVPTTTLAPRPAGVPTTSAAPTACTRDDVTVSTAVSGSGSSVLVTSQLQALRSCVFQPVAVAPFSCATAVVVDQGQQQVFPAPGQGEHCSAPGASTLAPGTVLTLRATWSQPPAGGGYVAVSTWAWSAGEGSAPVSVSARSAPFTVG